MIRVVLTIVAAAVCGPSFAQPSASSPAPAASAPAAAASAVQRPDEPQQITIYGTKQAKTRQQLGDSVGVLGAEDLVERNLQELRDVYSATANLSNGRNFGIVIRGRSDDAGVFGLARPTVSLVRDGVEVDARSAFEFGSNDLWDMEQVEVYRGTQTTNFGRGAIAGAIYLKSKDPTFSPEATARVQLGQYATRLASVAYSAPLVDKVLAFRIAADARQTEGDIRNTSFDNYAASEPVTLRGKLLFKPAGTGLQMLATLQHYRDRFNPFPQFFNSDTDDVPARVSREPARNRWTARNWEGSLDAQYALSPQWTLQSVTGFTRRRIGIDQRVDYDAAVGSPNEESLLSGGRQLGALDADTASQELRFNRKGEGWSGSFGAYASRLKNFEPSNYFDRDGNLTEDFTDAYRVSVGAAFGEATLELSPGWSLTAGGRYSRESSVLESAVDGLAAPAVRTTSGKFTPSLSLSRTLSPQHTLIGTWKRGYRPGGAEFSSTLADASGGDGITTFAPETADTLEVAWRAQLPDQRLRLAANLFHTRYKNQQVSVATGFTDPDRGEIFATGNAGSSRNQGLEVEAQWQAAPALALFASLGLVKTRYLDFPQEDGSNLRGESFGTPEVTAHLGGTWRPGRWMFSASANHQGKSFIPGFVADTALPARTLLDLRAGYEAEHWSATVLARNAADKRYLAERFGEFVSLAPARYVGVEWRAQW